MSFTHFLGSPGNSIGMKAKVTFDLDLSDMDILSTQAAAEECVQTVLLSAARAQHLQKLQEVRKDTSEDDDVRTIKMAELLKQIKITLIAEANISVEALPDDYPIKTELPFEKRYREPAAND